jgi:DNA-binding transcriptional LysR family regulator
MNEINIAKMDFNLLRALNALLIEKHAGRAASRLNVTQSAMSHTLSRLRVLFDDPLFIRTAKGLEPTVRALELRERLSLILNEINLLLEPQIFQPEKLAVRFKIQTHDFILSSYLTHAFSAINKVAPQVVFDIKNITSECYNHLEQGDADLIIGSGLMAKKKFIQTSMLDEQIVCLFDCKHPILTDWGIHSLFEYPHIKLSLLDDVNDPIYQYGIENELATRKIGAYTDSLHNQAILLKGTNFIAFLPASLAQQACKQYGLIAKPCPFKVNKVSIKGLWHERNQNNAAHQWLRSMLIKNHRTIQ